MSAQEPHKFEVIATSEICLSTVQPATVEQVARAAAVLDRYRFLQPIVVDSHRNIVAGHVSFWPSLKRDERQVLIVRLLDPAANVLAKGR